MGKTCDYKKPNMDCFAYSGTKKKCSALSKLMCTYKICPFYKSKEEISVAEIERAIRNYAPFESKK